MIVSGIVLNAMLNGIFNIGVTTYTIKLKWTGQANPESDPETIGFTTADVGPLVKTSTVSLDDSVFFVIAEGTTVTGFKVMDYLDKIRIDETFANSIVFNANGTLTVNNITVSVISD